MSTTSPLANNPSVVNDLTADSALLPSIEQSLVLAQTQLQKFASNAEFSQKSAVAFGDGADLKALQSAWLAGDFSILSGIEIRTSAELNRAKGAYSAATDTIYLSQEFWDANQDNPEILAAVLLEEVGHRLDARLNAVDAVGDEGAIFSREVQNIATSDTLLAQLQSVNDQSIVTIDGQQITVEQAGIYTGANLKAEIKDKIDDLLNQVKNFVNNDVLQGLPALGKKLGLANPLDSIFNGFRDQIISKVDLIPSDVDPVTAVKKALLDVLGPGTLNILRDSGNGNGIDLADIDVIESANSVTFKLKLGKLVDNIGIDLDGDIGLNGLGLKLNGTVKPTLDFAWNLEFGVNTTNGFFVNTNGVAPEISVDLTTQFVDSMNQPLSLSGSLGFLQLQAKDRGSSIGGKFTADLNNPLSSLTVTPKFVGNVNLKLGLDAGFGTGSNLPTIGTDFRLNWGFSPNAGADGKNGGVYSGGSPQVAFNNVSIDIASFFKDFAEPLAKKIDAILEPFNSTFNVLEKAIPILNDFGPISRLRYDKNNDGKVTLVDLILAQTPNSQITETIKTYRQFKELSDNIKSLSTIPKTSVNVGSFDLNNINLKATGFNLSQVNLNALNQTTKTATQILTSLELAVGGQTIKDFTGAIDTSGGISASKPQFSILTDPQQVFNLLVGKNAEFFKYNLPNLNVNVVASAFFPLFGPIEFDLRGMLQAKAQLSLGYDSYGIQEFTNQISQGGIADPSKIFDGFYIDNTVDANGPGGHKSGLVLNSDLGAYASISAGLFSAGVGGGIFGNPKILLTDPNGDGQVRLNEFDPSCIFNPVTGSIFASLNAFVEFDIGLFTIKERLDIEKNVFLDFALGCNTAERAKIAQSSIFATALSNGNLSLNVGPTSDRRFLNGVQGVDDAEVFVVDYENATLKVGYSGVFKNYQNANKIVANGGNENDTIVISDRVFAPVELRGGNEIAGRPGDRLFGGSGDDTLFGEGGDDYLYGGAGNDNLEGGNNDDLLNGGAGADTLNGGNGFDTASYKQGATTGIVIKNIANVLTGIEGDAIGDDFISIENIEGTVFNDTIEGSDIGEQIEGDSGDDSLLGGGGDDLLIGGLGKDSLDGGTGNDWASYVFSEAEVTVNLATNNNVGGDADGDVLTNIENLYGSTKADVLVGNAADNVINGFDGDDRIQGGAGQDRLSGQNNNDTLAGEAGDDVLNGDDGNDRLDGGADNDKLFGGKGQDTLIGGDGVDIMDGGEDADIYETSGTNSEYDTFNDTGINGSDTLKNTGITPLVLNSFSATNGIDAIIGSIVGNANDNSLDFSAVAASNLVVDGAAGDDVITGTNQDDRLSGGFGKDTILGLGGNDLIDGGSENDSLTGSAGKDTLIGGDGLDTMDGGEGDDIYEASGTQAENDIFNDTGTTGIDTLKNTGNTPLLLNSFSATNGIDAIIGSVIGNPNNTIFDFSAITASTVVADGAAGDDVIIGGTKDDELRGSEGKDSITGNAGNDFLDGGSDRDTLKGGIGDDHLRTFDLGSVDILDGEAGTNRLSADYSDQIVDITFTGGKTNNYKFTNGDTALNFQTVGDFYTGSGNDLIVTSDDYANTFKTNAGNDTIYAGGGKDTIDGGAGNDFINGGAEADVIDGGAGIDTVDYSDSPNSVIVNLATGVTDGSVLKITTIVTATNTFTYSVGSAASTLSSAIIAGPDFGGGPPVGSTSDKLSNIENVIGSNYGDNLTGSDKDNIITPGLCRIVKSGSENTPTGSIRSSVVGISSSFDIIDGGAGNDLLIVDYSVGDDGGRMRGGGEGDAGTSGRFTRDGTVGQPTLDQMDFKNIERLQVTGTSKNDTLNGGSGDDTLNGGAGNDILVGAGNSNSDITGNDVINGGEGDDEIANRSYGAAGSDVNLLDRFDGGAGFDTLSANFSNQTADVNFIDGQSNDITFTDGTFAKNFEAVRNFTTGSGNDNLILTGRRPPAVSDSINRRVNTGAGNDTIAMNGGLGGVQIDAGLGNDLLILDYSIDEPIGGGGVSGVVNTGDGSTSSNAAYTRNGANNTFLDRLNATNIERYQITGTSKDDKLVGWNGDDIFTGLGGNDTLTGGLGSDKFIFTLGSAVGRTATTADLGIDTITDFQANIDSIVLDPQIFGTSRTFASVTTDLAAETSNATIVYNSANGNLFYNPNGSNTGFDTGGQFAILSNKVALTANDLKTRGIKANDFNGDGKADILWRNDYGSVAVWQMNGATVTSGSLTSAPDLDSSWKVAGTGDFNGDGKSDILWRNTNGAIVVWAMDGATVKSSTKTSTPSLDNSWKTVGTGDYNGDGKSDILWRNDNGTVVVWTMDSATVASSSKTTTPVVDNSWKVAGNSDFDGDGKSDILWRNDDGSVVLWQMNGAGITAPTAVAKVATDWKIAGTGDFNGDSKADILWRNDDGRVVLWQMNGAAIASSSLTSTPSRDSSQTIAGIGDYNGDGRADILWRKDTGATEIWQMNGSTVVSSTPTSVAVDGSFWKIAAPII